MEILGEYSRLTTEIIACDYSRELKSIEKISECQLFFRKIFTIYNILGGSKKFLLRLKK